MTSSTLRGLVFGCVSDRSRHANVFQQSAHHPNKHNTAAPAHNKVKFGVPLSESVKDDCLPTPLVDMLVYIAKEGVTTTDLFRRGGNPTDLKAIMKKLIEGKPIEFEHYNFHTLASVIKKFLLKIPGGVFGPAVEQKLLCVLELDNRMEQYDTIHSIISGLSVAAQQLLALLFGTWFRIVNHCEYNTMSSEAMAKSVAGSLFHTCNDHPNKVEKAVQVLQILIDDFGVANMFGRKNIQYFADRTQTGIRVKEKFRYEYRYPKGGSQGSTQLGDDPGVSNQDPVELFALILQKEAARRGFNLEKDAITEEEFYGGGLTRGNAADTKGLGLVSSSPPSPQSLHPSYQDQTDHTNTDYQNTHKKLTHVSSLSAPDVNKSYSPTQELSPAKRMYLSTSSFEHVRRRQMMRMKKRTNWFLSPNSSVMDTTQSESMLGGSSMDGKSSCDATSSEAILSDVTDGGLSDSGFRLTSMDMTEEPSLVVGSGLMPNRGHSVSNVLNGNHRTSTPTKSGYSEQQRRASAGTSSSRSPSPQVTDRDVRYFMVENFYGSPTITPDRPQHS